MPTALYEFIVQKRGQIIELAKQRARQERPTQPEAALRYGVPLFLDQLVEALAASELDAGPVSSADSTKTITDSAARHGHDSLRSGFTLTQVVHGYGDICQIVTELAAKASSPISVADFNVFNRCLDDAIAGAVTEYGRQRERDLTQAGIAARGVLAHELRNLLQMAILSFEAMKSGAVGVRGSTGAVHARSLAGLSALVERSLAEVRLEATAPNIQRLSVAEFLVESSASAMMLAEARGVQFTVATVGDHLFVDADRQLLASALLNLLQNAFKFTFPGGKVSLVARATAERVQLDVSDECGGLPPGRVESLFLPFTQESSDRSGLGLGLSIALNAVRANSGALSVRDVPGVGCVFSIDLPLRRE